MSIGRKLMALKSSRGTGHRRYKEGTSNSRNFLLPSRPANPEGRRFRTLRKSVRHGFQQRLASRAAVAQLVARRSHNPKVVSSILTCRIFREHALPQTMASLPRSNLATLRLNSRGATAIEDKEEAVPVGEDGTAFAKHSCLS